MSEHGPGQGAAPEPSIGALLPSDADADPNDGRRETLNQRMDRNWIELLQELRVTQTGTQILTGFLLAVAFQQKFDELSAFQHRVYLALIITAVLTTALALAPVNLHRALFRRGAKVTLVKVSNALLRVVLLGVGLVLCGTVLLVFDVVAGRAAATVALAVTVVVIGGIAALPYALRRRRPGAVRRGPTA